MGATYPGRMLLQYWKQASDKMIKFGQWYCTDPSFRKSVQHEYQHLAGALQQGEVLKEMHRIKASSLDELIEYHTFLGRMLIAVPETPWLEVRSIKPDKLHEELKNAPANTRLVYPEPQPVSPTELAASIDFGLDGTLELTKHMQDALRADPQRRRLAEAAVNVAEPQIATYADLFVNNAYTDSDHS